MTDIVRILKEEMEIMHRTNRVDSTDVTGHVNIQDPSKFSNWSQVPKHHLVKDKPVVKSLQKSALSKYRFQTLHNLQTSTDNTTPETGGGGGDASHTKRAPSR
jgi:hypothetical protein